MTMQIFQHNAFALFFNDQFKVRIIPITALIYSLATTHSQMSKVDDIFPLPYGLCMYKDLLYPNGHRN